jgi:hypothetical protein
MSEYTSADLAERIVQYIQAVLREAHPAHQVYIRLADALPLHGNWEAGWFVRPTGEVLIVNWATQEILPENDLRRRYFMIKMGALRYPELHVLLPPRPSEVPDCPKCGGSGQVVGVDHHRTIDLACSTCAGLGWISEDL